MAEMQAQDLSKFIDMVYRLTRIRMDASKKALLVNRLERRLSELKIASYQDYYAHLERTPVEQKKFISAVTTNETYFFRAPKIWEFFSKIFLPKWKEANPGRTLAIWCAAASSGEEPYTIAMLCEEFAAMNPGFAWTLVCSDISEDMLAKCREASYSGRAIEKVEPRLLRKYFDAQDNKSYVVKDALKRKVKFFAHRLQDKSPQTNFGIVFLRNVLIYFDGPTKEQVLHHAFDALSKGGTLVVGESEGLISTKNLFTYVMPSVYTKGGANGEG